MRLSELRADSIAEVTCFIGDQEFANKMNALGIHSHNKIKFLRAGPFGGPLLIEDLASGGRIMVAQNLANNIEVEQVDNGGKNERK